MKRGPSTPKYLASLDWFGPTTLMSQLASAYRLLRCSLLFLAVQRIVTNHSGKENLMNHMAGCLVASALHHKHFNISHLPLHVPKNVNFKGGNYYFWQIHNLLRSSRIVVLIFSEHIIWSWQNVPTFMGLLELFPIFTCVFHKLFWTTCIAPFQ